MPGEIPKINLHLPRIKIPEAAQKENKQNYSLPSDTKVTSGTLTLSQMPEVKPGNLIILPAESAEAETKIQAKPQPALPIQPVTTPGDNSTKTSAATLPAADFAATPAPPEPAEPKSARWGPLTNEAQENRCYLKLRKNLQILLKNYNDYFANEETLKNIKEDDLKKCMKYVDNMIRTGLLILAEKDKIKNLESREFLFELAQNYNQTIEGNTGFLTVPSYRGAKEINFPVENAFGYLEHILLQTIPSLETPEVQEEIEKLAGLYSQTAWQQRSPVSEKADNMTKNDEIEKNGLSQIGQEMDDVKWKNYITNSGLAKELETLEKKLSKISEENNQIDEESLVEDPSTTPIIEEAKSRIQKAIRILKEKSINSISGLPQGYSDSDNDIGKFFKRVENIGHAGLIIISNSNRIQSQSGLKFIEEISVNYHQMISGDSHLLIIPTLPPYSLDVSTEYGVGQLNNIMSGID